MRYVILLTLIGLAGCCGGGNPDCIGFPAPWLWFGEDDHQPTSYENAVQHLPKGSCNDTGEDWPGVPKCPADLLADRTWAAPAVRSRQLSKLTASNQEF